MLSEGISRGGAKSFSVEKFDEVVESFGGAEDERRNCRDLYARREFNVSWTRSERFGRGSEEKAHNRLKADMSSCQRLRLADTDVR
jgi:hypothetical protein